MFNKHGLHGRWPRAWIIILALILTFLTFAIAGMEVGNTVYDLFRSTAFGGFIAFIPLIICDIFILITAFKPKLFFLRMTVILCCLMIILCIALITYDVFVIVDPTQCFFLSCNYAAISTSSGTFYGWPVTITWPNYFTTNMNAKKIFQSVQLLLSGLYILFASLYILTYLIYRHIKLNQQTISNTGRNTFTTYDPNRASARRYAPASSPRPSSTRAVSKNTNNVSRPYPYGNPNHKVTVYTVEGRPDKSAERISSAPAPREKSYNRPPSPRPVYSRAPSPRPSNTKAVTRNSNNVSQPYSHVNPNHKVTVYTVEGRPDTSAERVSSAPAPREKSYKRPPSPRPVYSRAPSPRPSNTKAVTRNSNNVSQPYSHVNPNQKVTVYTVEGQPDTSTPRYNRPRASSPGGRTTAIPSKTKGKTFVRPRASSLDDIRKCTRCNRQPRMVLATHYERQNYFSHLCVNCNKELGNDHRKTPYPFPRHNRHWIP